MSESPSLGSLGCCLGRRGAAGHRLGAYGGTSLRRSVLSPAPTWWHVKCLTVGGVGLGLGATFWSCEDVQALHTGFGMYIFGFHSLSRLTGFGNHGAIHLACQFFQKLRLPRRRFLSIFCALLLTLAQESAELSRAGCSLPFALGWPQPHLQHPSRLL